MKKIIVLLAVAALMLAMAGTAQAAVLFSVDHDNLPAVGDPVLTWDGFTKSSGSPTVVELRGQKWYSNKYFPDRDGMRHDSGQHAFGTSIPINGATIVTAVMPELTTEGDWSLIVDIFFDQLCLGINNMTGKVTVKVSGAGGQNYTWQGGVIPEEPGVLTLTVGSEADPAFEVFWQGADDDAPISMGTGNGNTGGQPYTALYAQSGGNSHKGYINIGRNAADRWSTYNGLIGDTYVYDEQLSPEELLTVQKQVLVAMGMQGTRTTPEDGYQNVDPLTTTELSWDLPYDPNNGVEVNVWFGAEQIPANQIVTNVIDANSITLAAANIVLAEDTDYTWHIEMIDPNDADTTPGNKEVLLFNNTYTFSTFEENHPPTITADSLGYQWLKDGTRTVGLTSVVDDEDGTALHLYTWSVVDAPAGATVEFSPNGTIEAANTEVTITVAEDYDIDVTDYVLQVEVDDNAEHAITDTVTVTVYANACDAARIELDKDLDADLNKDCEVNVEDLALMVGTWLSDTSLDGATPK